MPLKSILKKQPSVLTSGNKLRQLAFDKVAQANIITTVRDGKIILVNNAAAKLLGYSKKGLLTKNRAAVFNIRENSFKKMLRQRTAEGYSVATVTVFKKNNKEITCEITSALFMDEDGNENAVTTITDISQNILLQKNIDAENKKIVAANIVLAKLKQKDINIVRKQKVTDDIALAKSKQKEIDIINVKKVTDDIAFAKSKQKTIDTEKNKLVIDNIVLAKTKADTTLSQNNEWIKYIAKTSYDVMWDWDIVTGEIYVGDSVKEVFGYDVKNNTVHFGDFTGKLLAEEKNMVEKKLFKALKSRSKTWADTFMYKHSNGNTASTTSRANIIRDEAGKAIRLIGATQDISRLQELEKNLEEQSIVHQEDSDKFLLAAKLSFDVIWDWNLLTNEVFLGDGFEELFGYKIKNNKGDIITDWANYLHPDDRENVITELVNDIKSTAVHWECAYRVSRADGSIARVYVRASIIRHADGKAYRIMGAMQDLSRQKELEEKLEEEIKLKEKQIVEATADAKEAERSDIGKELHDNINQLLGASRMYIEMAKRGGKNCRMYLSRSSEYTITAIDEIRKLTKGLTTDIIKTLGLGDAIDNLRRDTMEVSTLLISCSLQSFKEKSVDDKFKLNVFRIIQEQLNNILKHARATKVSINILQNEKSIQLTITDNGVGFDVSKKQKGIGILNIKSRATTYHGTADFASQPGKGCILTAIFPATNLHLPDEAE